MNSVRQSLYLKYRPRRFDQLVGQEVVARTLRHAVRDGRVGHAYLFTGVRGTGKTSAARILARAVNCLAPEDGEPCGQCSPCQSVLAGRSLDVIEIDAATNRGIDEIRELRERAQFLPSELSTKVYIIDEVHMLTTEASNAFLKTLEEPPAHACFILATTEPQRLGETVLSRCQRFDFRLIPTPAVVGLLSQICAEEGVSASPEALQLIAEAGAGSMRDAESLLERLAGLEDGILDLAAVRVALGMADPGATRRLADRLQGGDLAGAWAELRELESAGIEPRHLLRALGGVARDRHWEDLKVSQGAPRSRFWLDLMDACARGGSELRRADDPWMALEVILLQVAVPQAAPPQRREGGAPAPAAPVQEPSQSVPGPRPTPVVAATAPSPQPPAPSPEVEPAEVDGAASAVPSPALEAAGIPVAAEVWRVRWPEVVEWAQLHHPGPFRALVLEASPTGLKEGVLTIAVNFEWHLNQLRSPAYRELLEQACQEVMGEGVTLELELAGSDHSEAAPQQDGSPSPAGGGSLAAALRHFPGSTVRKVDLRDAR